MDTSLDLVDHFKLEAEHLPEYTQHTHYKSDRSHGLRKRKIVKRWRKQHDIGEGTFGIVWLEVEEDGSERAVKAISKRLCSYNKIDYKKELAAMAILSKHEELFVAFHGWFEGPDHIFVAMEYFKHGDLQKHINTKMPEIQVKIVIAQVLEGLKTMHQLGFTHRDLKPQARHRFPLSILNIFVVDTDPFFWVKIGDFGITKRVMNEQTFLRTQVGTPDYLAPEVLGYVEEETSRYTNAVDLWSLGCICHRLLTLESPFPKMTALARYCLGMTELPIEVLYKSTVSEEAITLVKGLMNIQPSERIDAETALHSLWLKDIESLDSAFTVQSESHPEASADKDLMVQDAVRPKDDKLHEKPIVATKKKREAWYRETPMITGVGQSSQSTVILRSALDRQLTSTESQQGEGPGPMSTFYRMQNFPVRLRANDRDTASFKKFSDAGFDLVYHNVAIEGYAVDAFEWAATQPELDCLELLLKDPPMVDVTQSLHWTVRENALRAVQAIVKATHIDIDKQSYGMTPLHVACTHGHEEIVRYLIRNGARVNARNASGMTPLSLASLTDCESVESIKVLLIENGALEGHVPVASAPGISELMISGPDSDLAWDRPELQENQTFEPSGTLQELPDDDIGGAECCAARFRMAGHFPHVLALADRAFRWAAKTGSKDLMVYVLENGAPVNINALLSSVEVKCNPEASRLLRRQRDATYPWHIFTKPLHTACFYAQLGVVDSLPGFRTVDVSKILHARDYRGETALHKAIVGRGERKAGERVELIHKLLDRGADPIQRDMHGRTALLLARDLDHNEMIPALIAASKRMEYPISTLEEAISELGIMETPADIPLASSPDDEEVSSLKREVSFGSNKAEVSSLSPRSSVSFEDKMGNGLNKAEEVDGQKQSWWRSLLSHEAHLKPRKRKGTDRLSGDPSSRREDDLQEYVEVMTNQEVAQQLWQPIRERVRGGYFRHAHE